jgi:hypothetical protein
VGFAQGAGDEVSEPTQDYRVPVPPHIKEALNAIGNSVGSVLPPEWGFALLIFKGAEGSEDGALAWVSSNREDMLKVMQEFVRRGGE